MYTKSIITLNQATNRYENGKSIEALGTHISKLYRRGAREKEQWKERDRQRKRENEINREREKKLYQKERKIPTENPVRDLRGFVQLLSLLFDVLVH